MEITGTDAGMLQLKTVYGDPRAAELKKLGGRWQPDIKRWIVAEGKRAQIEALIASASPPPPPPPRSGRSGGGGRPGRFPAGHRRRPQRPPTPPGVRIPSHLEQVIIDELLGGGVRHHYVVTQDEWDEYDNEAPGEYDSVYVPEAAAALWDAGLAAARKAGFSRKTLQCTEALLIRYRIMVNDPTATLPPGLAALGAQRDSE